VYKYIRVCWGRSNEDAKDLTQEFFTQFLVKDILKKVTSERGSFRTYLRSLLKNFLIDQKRYELRDKRGGAAKKVSITDLAETPASGQSDLYPDRLFDIEWSRCVLRRALRGLEEILIKEGKGVYYEIFSIYDLGGSGQKSYKELAEKFSLKETDIRNHLSYARNLLKRIIKTEISGYTTDKSAINDELRFLLSL
jgi:RNA polymerase sigma factor (sigma-70 family)